MKIFSSLRPQSPYQLIESRLLSRCDPRLVSWVHVGVVLGLGRVVVPAPTAPARAGRVNRCRVVASGIFGQVFAGRDIFGQNLGPENPPAPAQIIVVGRVMVEKALPVEEGRVLLLSFRLILAVRYETHGSRS